MISRGNGCMGPTSLIWSQGLMCCAQTGISRLNAFAAMAGVKADDGTTGGASPAGAAGEQLCFLQCLLAHAACVLGTYVAGEARLVTGGTTTEAERYLPPGARFACRHAAEPGVLLVEHVLQAPGIAEISCNARRLQDIRVPLWIAFCTFQLMCRPLVAVVTPGSSGT